MKVLKIKKDEALEAAEKYNAESERLERIGQHDYALEAKQEC